MAVRFAQESEIEALARLWHSGWQDGHARVVPEALARIRTLDNFRGRLRVGLPAVRTIGEIGAPAGFHWVKEDELYQLYVAAEARGTGVASTLIADAEARMKESGVQVAWLACAIANLRAAKFYERSGWRLAGNMINKLDTPEGIFELEVWKYEKQL